MRILLWISGAAAAAVVGIVAVFLVLEYGFGSYGDKGSEDGREVIAASEPEFDDPAVAACEFMLRNSVISNPSPFERLSVRITGSTVEIDYQLSPLNTEPIKKTDRCQFTIGDDGFRFFRPKSYLPDKCIGLGEKLEAELAAARSAEERRSAGARYRSAHSVCHEQVVAAREAQVAFARTVEAPLSAREIYPIDPSRTALTVE